MTTVDLASGMVADFQAIVGARSARLNEGNILVDGVRPSLVVEPGSVEEAREVLRLASRAELAVTPRGNGSKLAWGNPPRQLDVILSTVRFDHILEHAADDLVVRVGAGVKLSVLQAELAKAGQRLALDPPELEATIGGIVASDASGPLRHRYGTVRDLILGITFVLADGTVAKSGGKVVKNVAGYDLAKLMTGSFGTLGLIVEAIFRLHPLPVSQQAVTVNLRSPEDLARAVQTILNSFLTPSMLELRWGANQQVLAVAFEGAPASVEAQTIAACQTLALFGEASRLTSEAAPPASAPGDVGFSLKVCDLPSHLPSVLREIDDLSRSHGLAPLTSGHAGLGIVQIDIVGGGEDALTRFVLRLREKVEVRGGSVQIRQASPFIKNAIDVWGSTGDALPIMRRVKERFDPLHMMSPGRLVGGL